MADRELVTNSSGLTVAVDIGRDMDRKTFDAMVERGDLKQAEKKSAKSKGK